MSRLQIRETDTGYELESVNADGIITTLLVLPSEARAFSAAHVLSDKSDAFELPRGSRTIPLKIPCR